MFLPSSLKATFDLLAQNAVPVVIIYLVILVVLVIVMCHRHRARRNCATPVTYSGPTQQPRVHSAVGTNEPGPPQVYNHPNAPSAVVAVGDPFATPPSYTMATSDPEHFPSVGCENKYQESGDACPYGLQKVWIRHRNSVMQPQCHQYLNFRISNQSLTWGRHWSRVLLQAFLSVVLVARVGSFVVVFSK